MPLTAWSKRLFNDRLEFKDTLSKRDVHALISNKDLKVLQCSGPIESDTWKLLNDEFFTVRPDVELRVYGFYTLVCDLSFISRMTNVHHFSADCLMDAVGIEHIAAMENLETLRVGIYNLEEFEFLHQITARLKWLFLGRTKSKKPDLSPLSRFESLEKIYIEGQQKNIEVLSQLKNLSEVTLRSITTTDLNYLKPLDHMWFLDIKLGGIKDLNSIDGMENIKYLELWQIRGLSDISVISNLTGLQYLFLQSLKQITGLPALERLRKLRRIYLENMKGLLDISSLESAPMLEEFVYWDARNFEPEDFLPLLRIPGLKRAIVDFGNEKKNLRFDTLAHSEGVEKFRGGRDFNFI